MTSPVTVRDGRIVDFYEFYDTERVLSATQG
jgi:ketosteroid isomerase-like protein